MKIGDIAGLGLPAALLLASCGPSAPEKPDPETYYKAILAIVSQCDQAAGKLSAAVRVARARRNGREAGRAAAEATMKTCSDSYRGITQYPLPDLSDGASINADRAIFSCKRDAKLKRRMAESAMEMLADKASPATRAVFRENSVAAELAATDCSGDMVLLAVASGVDLEKVDP